MVSVASETRRLLRSSRSEILGCFKLSPRPAVSSRLLRHTIYHAGHGHGLPCLRYRLFHTGILSRLHFETRRPYDKTSTCRIGKFYQQVSVLVEPGVVGCDPQSGLGGFLYVFVSLRHEMFVASEPRTHMGALPSLKVLVDTASVCLIVQSPLFEPMTHLSSETVASTIVVKTASAESIWY